MYTVGIQENFKNNRNERKILELSGSNKLLDVTSEHNHYDDFNLKE